MDNRNQPSHEEAPARSFLLRAFGLFSGDMRMCGEWVKRQPFAIQLLDSVFRGVAQVMFVNNPLSGLLITTSVFLQNPWWALNGLLGTLVSTVSAIILGQNREAVSAGLYGYNGTLVGILMAVFSAKESWYWWLLLPNVFMSMVCPVVTKALSTVASKWDLPVFTLPFNILVCLHMAATGANHPYFPEVDIKPNNHLHAHNDSIESLKITQLLLSVPVGVSQVYGCNSPWKGGLILLALLLSSPTICFHAMLGSAAGMLSGVFYVLTWQTHLLALMCALFCAYMTSAISKLMSVFALPACTWPFCLSTLIFLLISSEIPAICRLPLSVVSYPEENRHYQRQLKTSEKAQHSQQSGGQEEAPLKENGGKKGLCALCRDCLLCSAFKNSGNKSRDGKGGCNIRVIIRGAPMSFRRAD
ncbi:urea transporter 2-like [Scomber japonicus]|uniref:urea transporter 2-like n=1 Tax=Scomber japonicus TaxID=13676 RepID=UPI002304D9B0|nr:urea transporter 2-like [Scomber japonicus]